MNVATTVLARRPLAALLLGSALALPLAGCGEDPTVASATGFGTRFERLAEDYRKLAGSRSLIGETGPVENTSDLAGLLAGLNQLSGGTPEQSASAALLRAKVASDLGTLEAGRAARAEAGSRQMFELIGAIADAAARIETLSEVELSLAADRERLAAARSSAEAGMGTLRGVIAAMREPIARLGADRERRLAEIATIDAEIADLRRDAAAAGARAGFPLVEEAAELNGQAIRLRTRSALELGQLSVASDELALAETTLVAAEGLAGSAQSGLKELEDFSATIDRDAKAGRELVTTLRTEAEALLAKVDELRGESLDGIYSAAANAFGEASAAADAASDVAREAADQFKLGSLRARASMLQSRIAGLDAEAALRERLADAGSLFGGEAKAKPALEAIEAERATLLEEAKATYGEALSSLESIRSDLPSVSRIKVSIEASLALLEGKSMPAAGGPSTGGAAAGGSRAADGFPSPKAVVDFVNSIGDTRLGGGMEVFRAMHASSPESKLLLESIRSTLFTVSPFFIAAEKTFGNEAVASAAAGSIIGREAGTMITTLSELTVVSEDADSAQVTTGSGATVSLVRIDGSWYIDADALMNAMGGAGEDLTDLRGMFAEMKPSLSEAAESVADRIEAGEFADARAAMAAFDEAVRNAMVKAMGGGRP